MTFSDVLAVDVAAADVAAAPAAQSDRARVRARVARARVSPRSVLVNSFAGWGRQTWTDLRDAWFMPASLPTFRTAWLERMPDRDRVPGSNAALYAGWVAYNHTVGLVIPAVALAVVGLITPLLWIVRHPARLLLTAVIVTALYALTLN